MGVPLNLLTSFPQYCILNITPRPDAMYALWGTASGGKGCQHLMNDVSNTPDFICSQYPEKQILVNKNLKSR